MKNLTFVSCICLLVSFSRTNGRPKAELDGAEDIEEPFGMGITSLTPDNFIRGDKLVFSNTPSKLYPEECNVRWTHDSGSALLGKEVEPEVTKQSRHIVKWPNATMYYLLRDNLDEVQKDYISRAISEFHKKTCIRMVDVALDGKQNNFVWIKKPEAGGCASNNVGMKGGRQDVELNYWCMEPKKGGDIGSVLHEMMHVLGFIHEHTRKDRDAYVIVNTENIIKTSLPQFIIEEDSANAGNYAGPNVYDFGSLMHYHPYSSAISGKKSTMIPVDPKVDLQKLYQRKGFSSNDLLKINAYYDCKKIETLRANEKKLKSVMRSQHKGPCTDVSNKCQIWAAQNFCTDDRVAMYMLVNCKKSCKLCS